MIGLSKSSIISSEDDFRASKLHIILRDTVSLLPHSLPMTYNRLAQIIASKDPVPTSVIA